MAQPAHPNLFPIRYMVGYIEGNEYQTPIPILRIRMRVTRRRSKSCRPVSNRIACDVALMN